MSEPPSVAELLSAARQRFREGAFAEAKTGYEQAIAFDKLNVEAHEGLAMACFAAKDYAAAAAGFTRLTQLKPMDAKAWVNLGAVYNCLHQYQKAVDACRKGAQRDKKCAEAQYNLGLAFKGMSQSSMAASAYREALKLNPSMVEAHANLANVLVDMKNFQQAIAHYQKALEIDPGFDRARRGLKFAEEASQAARSQASPFGRLVDEKSVGHVVSHVMSRRLTEQERQEDRARLYAMCPEIDLAASRLLAHVRDDLERRLLTLNRTLAQGKEGRADLIQAGEDFRISLMNLIELRKALRRKALELRAHEEIVCTPNFAP